MPNNNNYNAWGSNSRGNLDMPNLQNLGINPQGQNPSNQGSNMNNPLGKYTESSLDDRDTDIRTFSFTAIVAAALNQFGLMNGLQNPNQEVSVRRNLLQKINVQVK